MRDGMPTPRGLLAGSLAVLALATSALPAAAANYSRALTIPNPTPEAQDLYGNTIAAFGDDILVGTPLDDTMATNAGAVYRFDGTTGALLQTYYAPTPTSDAFFGEGVVPFGADILVGASLDDVPGQDDAGAVYLLDGTTGALIRTFVSPTPVQFGRFGAPVRVVGNNVAIGASFDNPAGPETGAVYLFDGTTGGFLHKFTSPSTNPFGTGWGHSLETLGTNILVGAPFDSAAGAFTGSVFMYDAEPSSLTFGDVVHTFVSPSPGREQFGDGVNVGDGKILISATSNDDVADNSGVLYVFNDTTWTWERTIPNPSGSPNEYFGNVATTIGTTIAVGAATHNAPPYAFTGVVYRFDANTGALLQTIDDPTPEDSDFFGNALARRGDQLIVAAVFDGAGGPQAGTVYVFDPCGNGIPTASEQCDDGNATSGDCCSPTCQFETPGASCPDDGNLCTNDVCNASGTCTHPNNTAGCDDGDACTTNDACFGGTCVGGPAPACDPCEVCDAANGCHLPVAPGCQPALAGKAIIALKDGGADPRKDKATSKWKSSAAVDLMDFGDPSTSSGYVFCVIDHPGGQPTLRLSSRAPAGGTCGPKACWKGSPFGWTYKDGGLDPDGLSVVQLKAGGAGQAKIVVKGKGANLGVPMLGLTGPAIVRVLRTDAPVCWEATYTAAIRNDATQFKAKNN